jgi:hypothetical protein
MKFKEKDIFAYMFAINRTDTHGTKQMLMMKYDVQEIKAK